MAGKDAFTDITAPGQCRTAQFIKAGERFRTDRCTVIPSCIQKEVFTITRYMNSFEERQFIHYCGGNQLLHAVFMQVDDNGVFTIQKQEKLFPRARYKLQYRILTRYAVGKLHIAESAAPLFILRPLQIYTVSRSVVRKVSAGALQLELDQLTTLLLI